MLNTLQSIVPFLWSLLGLWSFIHGDTMCEPDLLRLNQRVVGRDNTY